MIPRDLEDAVRDLIGPRVPHIHDIVAGLREEEGCHRRAETDLMLSAVALELLIIGKRDLRPVLSDLLIRNLLHAKRGEPLLGPAAEGLRHGCAGKLPSVQPSHPVADDGKSHLPDRCRADLRKIAVLIRFFNHTGIRGCHSDIIHISSVPAFPRPGLRTGRKAQRSLNSKSSFPRRILEPSSRAVSTLLSSIFPFRKVWFVELLSTT